MKKTTGKKISVYKKKPVEKRPIKKKTTRKKKQMPGFQDPNTIINWTGISNMLAGNAGSIRSYHIPTKYKPYLKKLKAHIYECFAEWNELTKEQNK